jgi:glyoxylase-like metal-dependent hydrolase (beta-lactamase superfamily II)
MKIGEIQISPLSDGELHIPPTELLNKAMDAWENRAQFLDEEQLLPVNFGGFLVRTSDKVVVVDTGIGGGAIPEMPIGSFPDKLAEAGVVVADVDVVVFTHLHFDHVGWSTDGANAMFGNASHHCSKVDWDYWITQATPETGPGRDEFGAIPAPERLAPLADRMSFFDGDAELVPGVKVRPAPGHTPGHYIVEVSSNGETALLLADVAHSPAELLEDDWSSPTDEDPQLAQQTRAELAREMIRTGALATMTHFGGNGFGRLVERDGQRDWEPA